MKDEYNGELEVLLIRVLLGIAASLMTIRNAWFGIFMNRNRLPASLESNESLWNNRLRFVSTGKSVKPPLSDNQRPWHTS